MSEGNPEPARPRPAWRAWAARWSSVLLVGAASAVTLFQPYMNGPPIRSDGVGYHLWTYALLRGDLSFSWFAGDLEDPGLHQPDPHVRRFTCKYPPGVALLRLPVMALVTDPWCDPPPYSRAEHWACLVVGAAALVATVSLMRATCLRLGTSPGWANSAVLMLTLGAGLFHYGTYDASFSHVYSAFLAAVLVWLAVRAADRGRPLPVLPVAAAAASLLLVRTTNVLLVGFWGLGCFLLAGGLVDRSPGFRVRAAGGAALGVLVSLAATLALNHAMFGRLTLHTYTGEHFNWDKSKMLSVLWEEEYGVFRVFPVLAVALVAGLLARRTRLAAGCLAAAVAAYTVLYGHWWTWHLGSGFGHRGFVDLVPFAVPVLAASLNSLPRFVSVPLVLAGVVATCYTLLQMGLYWANQPLLPL